MITYSQYYLSNIEQKKREKFDNLFKNKIYYGQSFYSWISLSLLSKTVFAKCSYSTALVLKNSLRYQYIKLTDGVATSILEDLRIYFNMDFYDYKEEIRDSLMRTVKDLRDRNYINYSLEPRKETLFFSH